MNLEEIERRDERDGVICISDNCISQKGDDFETTGEFCSECDCGVTKEQLKDIEELNAIRIKYSQPKLKIKAV
jgi:hypothetical protein